MAISDDIRRMSDELARDPKSPVFLQLGEALRRQGNIDLAYKVATKGIDRHPHMADAYDLLARVYVDQNDFERAAEEWDKVIRLVPRHLGAMKGMGFICYQRERFADAERYLSSALSADPTDDFVASALLHVRTARRTMEKTAETKIPAGMADDSRFLFVDVLSDDAQTGLLLDSQGLVLAGAYYDADGHDVGQVVGAELSGVTDSARRATRHLALGDWTSIVFECEAAVVAMAPTEGDGLLVLATARSTPLGLARRLLDKCREVASRWLRGIG